MLTVTMITMSKNPFTLHTRQNKVYSNQMAFVLNTVDL